MNSEFKKNFFIIVAVCALFITVSYIRIPFPGQSPEIMELDETSSELEIETVLKLERDRWRSNSFGTNHLQYSDRPGDKVYWHRIDIESEANRKRSLVAEIQYPHLYEVDFYLVNGKNTIIDHYVTGISNERPFKNRLIKSQNIAYPFRIKAGEKMSLYVKVRSTGIIRIPIIIMEAEEYDNWTRLNDLILGGYLGGFLCMILYNLFIYFSTREITTLLYVLFHAVLWVFHFCYLGFGYIYVFDGSIGAAVIIMFYSFLGMNYTGLLFLNSYLKFEKLFNNMYHVRFLEVLILLTFPLAFFIPAGTFINIVLAIFVISFALIIIFLVPVLKVANIGSFLVAWAGLLISTTIHVGTYLNIVPLTLVTHFILYFGVLWEMTILSKVIGDRIKLMEVEKSRIRNDLIEKTSMEKADGRRENLGEENIELTKRNVSIMFVDIVGFSQIAEKLGSQGTFKKLSKFMDILSRTILKYGGTIDRSLGDGVLTLFGSEDDKNQDGESFHGNRAFLAAVEIERLVIERVSLSQSLQSIAFPIRIGIHVDDVYIGNLGGRERIDYTLIGSGVNFASHLESSCNPFRIMISRQLKDRLDASIYHEIAMIPVIIKAKHDEIYEEAYEYNPHFKSKSLIIGMERRYWQFLDKKISDMRTVVQDMGSILLKSQFGSFEIVNYSLSGLCLYGKKMVGRTTRFSGILQVNNATSGERLSQFMLNGIEVEVLWSRPTHLGYKHGVKIIGLSDEQKVLIHNQLSRNLSIIKKIRQTAQY
ncbi:MAG: hypothetical protein HQK54_05510 [Oligoflexales bacterium]|nr:hypothetical protein [Oligoflexales bacterium]